MRTFFVFCFLFVVISDRFIPARGRRVSTTRQGAHVSTQHASGNQLVSSFVRYRCRFRLNPKYGSVDEDVFMSTPPTMTGAFARQPSTGSGKQLVFCIHGKPSGCCATLVSTEDSNSNHEKPDPADGKSPITICE